MTIVGGTTLSTEPPRTMCGRTRRGSIRRCPKARAAECRSLFDRPQWQNKMTATRDTERSRLTPDVSAVADPFTGVQVHLQTNRSDRRRNVPSLRPIWAALTVLMNQYLVANGGHPLGDANPSLYQVAAGADLPGFRDVRQGGNAVDYRSPGL